jgi:hypothetical protein
MAKKETTAKKATTKKTTTKRVMLKKADTKIINPIVEVEKDETPTLNYEEEKPQKEVVESVISENNNDINDFASNTQEETENVNKINNHKVNERIDNMFGYLWNGQEMDY